MERVLAGCFLLLVASCYAASPLLEDDDSNNPNRNNVLIIYGCEDANGVLDGALRFASTADYVNSKDAVKGYLTPWKGLTMGLTSIKIETRFRVDVKTGLHWIVDLGSWNGPTIYTDGSAIKFFYKLNDGTTNTLVVHGVPNPAENPEENPWITVTAIVNPYTDTASLYVEGVETYPANGYASATLSAGQELNPGDWQIEIGGHNTYSGSPSPNYHFYGLIDEVKISTFDDLPPWT